MDKDRERRSEIEGTADRMILGLKEDRKVGRARIRKEEGTMTNCNGMHILKEGRAK